MSIASFAKQDLWSRLRFGQQLPAELTLESMADHNSRRFAPVGAAAAEFVLEGGLLKGVPADS